MLKKLITWLKGAETAVVSKVEPIFHDETVEYALGDFQKVHDKLTTLGAKKLAIVQKLAADKEAAEKELARVTAAAARIGSLLG